MPFTGQKFERYRKEFLFDASEEKLRECVLERSEAKTYFLWYLVLSVFMAVVSFAPIGVGRVPFGRFSFLHLLTLLFLAGAAYCIRELLEVLDSCGPLYDFRRCEALRVELERNRSQGNAQDESDGRGHEYGGGQGADSRERQRDHQHRQRHQQGGEESYERPREPKGGELQDLAIYYRAVLGLAPDETRVDVIEQAFRRAAMSNHPDRNPNDPFATERFKRIREAYEARTGK